MAWRLARSLERMREQFNLQRPNRRKHIDGTIGDAAHRARGQASDHNPWVKDGKTGVVTALDVTHDPAGGVDTWAIAEQLRRARDPRAKYVISNYRIFAGELGPQPWVWRAYRGANPHASHFHVSVRSTKAHYDNQAAWSLFEGVDLPASTMTAEQAEELDAPSNRPVLRRGSRDEAVKCVQRILMISVDGIFGPATEEAIRFFQRRVSLSSDGIVGPLTWAALDSVEQVPSYYDAPHPLSEPLNGN